MRLRRRDEASGGGEEDNGEERCLLEQSVWFYGENNECYSFSTFVLEELPKKTHHKDAAS